MKKTLHPSRAISWSALNMSQRHQYSDGNFSRYGFYWNKRGIVGITEFSWRTNRGVDEVTDFETVIAGRKYRMSIYAVGLPERSLKQYASRFLSNIKE